MRVVAIFGPTAVGKTGVAIALAELLRERGEDPVAVNCDALQVYSGLEVISGAPAPDELARLEHRLLGIVPVDGEFSAGRFANLAHAEIDALVAARRRPILVGGTGLYLRAALADLDLRPPVPPELRERVEREMDERGAEALHAELDPDLAATVHPRDRKRIARWTELQRAGIEPPASSERLWTQRLRRPALLVGLVMERDLLAQRIAARVDAMVAAGAAEEARRAAAAGASRTARAALGFEELLRGDTGAMKAAHRRYARRQATWMRKMEGIEVLDRTRMSDEQAAAEILALLGRE